MSHPHYDPCASWKQSSTGKSNSSLKDQGLSNKKAERKSWWSSFLPGAGFTCNSPQTAPVVPENSAQVEFSHLTYRPEPSQVTLDSDTKGSQDVLLDRARNKGRLPSTPMNQSMDQGPGTQKDWCSPDTRMTSASGHEVEMKRDNITLNQPENYISPSGSGTVSTSSTLLNSASGKDGSSRYPEEELDLPIIPGLGDLDFPASDDPTDSSEPSKPKLTSEEATDILLHFGLGSEDLEYLVSCPEDQITRTKLPLILHQLRLQNEKRAATKAQPQLARTASEEDSLQSSGGAVIRQEKTEDADMQSGQGIDHGLAGKQMTGAGDDHGGQSDREIGGGSGNTYTMDIDHHLHQEPLEKSITVFGSSSEEEARSFTSLCATGKSELSPEPPSSDKTKQSKVYSNKFYSSQTFHSIMNILSMTTIDTNIRDLYSGPSNLSALNQQVVEGQSTCENQPPANQLHGMLLSHTSHKLDTNDSSQSTGSIVQDITKQGGTEVEQNNEKAVQQIQGQPMQQVQKQIQENAREWTEMPNALSPTEQVVKTKEFGKMVSCPGVISIQMKLQPKDEVAAAVDQPTPEMKYDFAAAKPRHFPHTCVLCKRECADMKDWSSHLVSIPHRDSCRLLRLQYPKWNGYVEAGPRIKGEDDQLRNPTSAKKTRKWSSSSSESPSPHRHHGSERKDNKSRSRSSTPQSSRAKHRIKGEDDKPRNPTSAKKTRKWSSSSSESPSPHRHHGSESKDDKSRSRSSTPQSSRAKHSYRSRSSSPERKPSPRRKDTRTSSPKRLDRRSPLKRGRESRDDDEGSLRRRSYESRPLKRRNNQRQSPPRKVGKKHSPPRREDDRRSPLRRGGPRWPPPRREDYRKSPPRRVDKGRSPLRRGGQRRSPQRRRDDSRSPPLTRGRRSYREEWSPQRKRSGTTESLAKQILDTAGVQSLSSPSDVEALVKTLAPALMAEFAKLTSSQEETNSLPLAYREQNKYPSYPSKTISSPPSPSLSSSSSSSSLPSTKMEESRLNKCKANVTFEREEDAERLKSCKNISVKGEKLTVVKSKVAASKKSSESPPIEPSTSEDHPPPLGSKKVTTSKLINRKPATKNPTTVVRTVKQAKSLASKMKNVSTKMTTKTKTIRKETAQRKEKTTKAKQEAMLESNTTNPESQPNSCDSEEKPETSEASSEGPDVGLIDPVVFNMLANSPVSTPEAGPSEDDEDKAEMVSTAQNPSPKKSPDQSGALPDTHAPSQKYEPEKCDSSVNEPEVGPKKISIVNILENRTSGPGLMLKDTEEVAQSSTRTISGPDKDLDTVLVSTASAAQKSRTQMELAESRSDVKLQIEENEKSDGAPSRPADSENQPHGDSLKLKRRETSIQESLNVHKGITESVKTSPPTMVKLHGIDKSLSHNDVLLAVENFGKTKSVVLFRARSEACPASAVVIFEKEEDAKRLKMAESIDVKGLTITIIREKDAVSKEEGTSPQKKPVMSVASTSESKDKTVFSFSYKTPKSASNITDETVLVPEVKNVPAQLMVKTELLALVGDGKTALKNQKTPSDSKSRPTEILLGSGDSKQTLLPEKPISVVKEPAVEDKPIEPAKDMTVEAKVTAEAISAKQAKVPVDEQPTGQNVEEAATQDGKTNPRADKEISKLQQRETEVQAPLKVPKNSAVVDEKKEETFFEQTNQGKFDKPKNTDIGEPMELEVAEPVDTRISIETKDKETRSEAVPEDSAYKTKECQQTKEAGNSAKVFTKVQKITLADPESTEQEPKTWAGASQEQHQATGGTKAGVVTVTPSGEAAQKGTSKASTPPIKEISAVSTVAPTSVKTKPTAASVSEKKPSESKPKEPKPKEPKPKEPKQSASNQPTIGELLHMRLFPQRISCVPRLTFIQSGRIPDRKQLLMCGLPMYCDGVYTEDDVAQLLYPYGLINKAFRLYIIPQARMAFITLSKQEDVYYLMRSSVYEGIYFRGLRLIFDLHQKRYSPSPAQFYKFLKKELNCSVLDEAERTVLIRGLSAWEVKELREALKDFAPVSNFMPILNKLFIEFQFVEDTLRFRNWYCCLKQVSGCNVSLLQIQSPIPPLMTQKFTATAKTTENVPAAVKGMIIAVQGPGTSDQKLPAAEGTTMHSVAEDVTVAEAPENQSGTCACNQYKAPGKQPGTCVPEQKPKPAQLGALGKQTAICLHNKILKLDKPEVLVKQPNSIASEQTPKPSQSGTPGKQPAICFPNQSPKPDKIGALVKQPNSTVLNQTSEPAQPGAPGKQPATCLPNQSLKPDKIGVLVKQQNSSVPNQSPKPVQPKAPGQQPATCLPSQSPKPDKPEALGKQPNSTVPNQTPKPAQSGAPGKRPYICVSEQKLKPAQPNAPEKQPAACLPKEIPKHDEPKALVKQPNSSVPVQTSKPAQYGAPGKKSATCLPNQSPKSYKPGAQVKQQNSSVRNQSLKPAQPKAPGQQPDSGLPNQSSKSDKPEALGKPSNSILPNQSPKPAQPKAPGQQPASCLPNQSPKPDKSEVLGKQPNSSEPNQTHKPAQSGTSVKQLDPCAQSGPLKKQPATCVPELKPKPVQYGVSRKQSGPFVPTQKPKPDQSGADTRAPSQKYEPEKCDSSVNIPEVGPKKTSIINKSENRTSGPGLMLKDNEEVAQSSTRTISGPDKDLDKVLVSIASAAQKSRTQIELAESRVETEGSKNVKTEQDVTADSENHVLGISLKAELTETTIQKSLEMSNETDPVTQETNMIVVEQGEQEEDEPMELGVSGVPIKVEVSAEDKGIETTTVKTENSQPQIVKSKPTAQVQLHTHAVGEAAVEEEMPEEKAQTTTRKGSLAAEMTEMDSTSTKDLPSEDVQVPSVLTEVSSAITKPTVAAASEQQSCAVTCKTIGENLEKHLFPQLIACFPATFVKAKKYIKSVLIDNLPTYHDGLYTEDDVADLLSPYGLKSKEMLYVIPQTCMAFVTMPNAIDVKCLMEDSLKGIDFKGKRLRFRIMQNNMKLNRCNFYKFLKQVMKCASCVDEDTTVLIHNISSKEVSDLREALKNYGEVSNFMPLLNKLFIQFGSVDHASRFGHWYSHLNEGPIVMRLVHVKNLDNHWTPPSSSSRCSTENPTTAREMTDNTHLTPGEKLQLYITRKKTGSIICKPGNSSKMLITWQSGNGSFTEEDFIELLTPFGYHHKVHHLYVLPQVHLAFVWMPTPESVVEVIMAAKQDPIILKGSELSFFSTNFSFSVDLLSFYKSLNDLIGNSVGEKLQRIIFIRNISPTETMELREVLKKMCPLRNFLPLLNKVFVEFYSVLDSDLLGVWYCFLKDPPSYRILRLKIPPARPVTQRPDTRGLPLDSKVVFEGATIPKLNIPRPSFGPFWLSLRTSPFMFPTFSPWFNIPKSFTITNLKQFESACTEYPNCQTVMLTGLPEEGYKHEDVAKLVWPHFSKQTLHTLYYNVIILPLQRMAFIFFPDQTSCHNFLKDVSTTKIVVKKTKLGAHLVTETMNPDSSEEMMYKSMMQWSNTGNLEITSLADRLLCVEVSEVSLDIIRLVLKTVDSITTLVSYLALANRICIELNDSSCVAKMMEKYKDLYPKSFSDDPAWSRVVHFETLESLKQRMNDIGDAHINLESKDMTRDKYEPPPMDKDMLQTIKVTVGRFRVVETSTDLGQDFTTDDAESSHTHTFGDQQELGYGPSGEAYDIVQDTSPELHCHSLPEQNWGEPSESQSCFAVPPQPYTSTRSSTYCRGSSWSRTDSRCLKVLFQFTESPTAFASSTSTSELFSSCPQVLAESPSVLRLQEDSSESQVTISERGKDEDHHVFEDKVCPGELKKIDIKTEDGGLVQEGRSNLQQLSVEDAIPYESDDKSLIKDIIVKQEETKDEDFSEEADRWSKEPPSGQGDGMNPEQEEQNVKFEESFTGSYEAENPQSGIRNGREPVKIENKDDSKNPDCDGIKQEPFVILDSSDDQTEREENQEHLCDRVGREDIYLVVSSDEDQPKATETETKHLRSKRWNTTTRKCSRPSRKGNPVTEASKSSQESPNRQDRRAVGEILDSVKDGAASAKESSLRRSTRGSTLDNSRPVFTKTSAKEEKATDPALDSANEGPTVRTRSTRGKRERTSEDVIIIEDSMPTRKSHKKLPLSQEDQEISMIPQKAAHEGRQSERKTLRSSQSQHDAEAVVIQDEEREDTSTFRTRGQLRQKTVQSPVRKSTRGKDVKSQELQTEDGSRAHNKALSKQRREVAGPVSKRTRLGSPHGSKPSDPKPDNLTGKEFVVPAYYCSLCSVFYQNDADEPHCSSRTHLNNLQKHYQGLQKKS